MEPQVSHSVIDTNCKYLQPRNKDNDAVVLTSLFLEYFSLGQD